MAPSRIAQSQLIRDYKQCVRDCEVKAVCGRSFIRTERLKTWMDHRKSDLLYEAYTEQPPWNTPTVEQIWGAPHEEWLVFALLLEIDRGDLIHLFLRLNFHTLPIRQHELHDQLAQNIDTSITRDDCTRIANHFDQRQYAFCPVQIGLGHDKHHSDRHILPIHRKENINTKGATASIWQIEILEEFLEPSLRKVLEQTRFHSDDSPPGVKYNLAMKTFPPETRVWYTNEISAFAALKENKGMLQYLGNFAQDKANKDQKEYNILLEYGDFDLEEYFDRYFPPVLPDEILEFWTSLFEVARAIERVHKIKTKRGERQQEYYGWHADIKPDNILFVQKRLKLADPGFARFERAATPDQKTNIMGGTETYGAPEFQLHGQNPKPVSQSIDIWSFGCVLSIAASWVVLGVEGMKQFYHVRAKAVEQLFEDGGHDREINITSKGDFFHDGKDVLKVVGLWHGHLRDSLRKSDPITGQVLDLVDSSLLRGDPNSRIRASNLCQELDNLLKRSREEQRTPLDPILRDAFVAVENNASDSMTDRSYTLKPATPAKESGSSESSKTKKIHYSKRPVKKTTYRTEVLDVQSGSEAQAKRLPTIHEPRQVETPPQTPAKSTTTQQEPRSFGGQQSYVSSPSSGTQPHFSSSPAALEQGRLLPYQPYDSRPSLSTMMPRRRHVMQDVFAAREEAEKSRKSRNPLKRHLPGDAKLKKHFVDRDIRFLVDNADSMARHWPAAIYLLTTLVMKANGVDDNGMDLSFTNGSAKLKESNDPRKFEDKMRHADAKPLNIGNNPTYTDISKCFGEIMEEYTRRVSIASRVGKKVKNLTVIVLTDGLWEAMERHCQVVSEQIIDFQKRLKDLQGGSFIKRQVTFQFVQFGHDSEATKRLQYFDDQVKGEDIEDIVDTEHLMGDVYKMFLGSFEQFYDDIERDNGSLSPTVRHSTFQSTADMSIR